MAANENLRQNQAKGGKQRSVPLLPDLTHELRTSLRDRTTGPLFVTIRHTPYSPRRIQQIVQETAALAGITTRVYPHLLRHSVATTLLERGMPLEQIQQFLGHTKLGHWFSLMGTAKFRGFVVKLG